MFDKLPKFAEKLSTVGLLPLRPTQIEIFQINVGKMCNQTCKHCHVDAGPHRQEIMTRETMELCLKALREISTHKSIHAPIHSIDLTGGAPEMNPHFRWFVEEIRKLPRSGPLNIIVRCNLTIIVANAKYQDLPRFFAQHKIHVISSLPYYDARNTDRQRGNGVFERSIRALKMLNEVGYGKLGSGLTLDLVYNPVGAFLPPPQQSIEDDFKQALKNQHGVDFNSLFTITNMPIARFLEYLIASDNLENYMEKLVNAFNPAAAQGVMCRNTLSIGWDGALYDCDFNQMLDIKIAHGSTPPHLRNIDWQALATREIKIDQHCYGCTAGSGSSCGGQIAPSPLLDRL